MAAVATEEQPISRTYQYRKVMKPMLERKRRARINRCLDELKELLVGALQAEGESVSRLEKADVLELTVRHLHKLRRAQQLSESSASDRFRAGFSHCANEVTKYMSTLTSSSSIDISVSSRLLSHLDGYIQSLGGVPVSAGSPPQPMTPSAPIPVPHNVGSPAHHPHPMHHHHQQHPSGLNVLTNYTPPSSPVSSPNNPKLLVYSSPSPAHMQSPFGNLIHQVPISHHPHPHHPMNSPQPLSLCTKEEPFDLSSGSVWRPW